MTWYVCAGYCCCCFYYYCYFCIRRWFFSSLQFFSLIRVVRTAYHARTHAHSYIQPVRVAKILSSIFIFYKAKSTTNTKQWTQALLVLDLNKLYYNGNNTGMSTKCTTIYKTDSLQNAFVKGLLNQLFEWSNEWMKERKRDIHTERGQCANGKKRELKCKKWLKSSNRI